MLQSIQDHPIMYLVALLLLGVCVFAWVKATKSSKLRNQKRDAIIAELKREKELRQAFKSPTLAQLEDSPPARLIEGLCSFVQMHLEKQDDIETAFVDLPEAARFVYALGYVLHDGATNLSRFFRKNGQPLTGVAFEAVKKLMPEDYADVFCAQYTAYDEDHEDISLVESEIAQLDQRHSDLVQQHGETLYIVAKDYILLSFAVFTSSLDNTFI